jgi:hypothetical protein
MLNKKIIGIFLCIFLLSISAGALSSANTLIKFSNKEVANFSYSHNILGEFFTMTTCVPCKYSHRALKNLYDGEYHPFNYISMVYVKNKWAQDRYGELDVDASPTVMWDGPFDKVQGSTQNIEQDMALYNSSIIDCGNRNVKDIDLFLDVDWLGAVNKVPEDGVTDVPILQVMSWTISQMRIDVEVTNNEASQYNGHLHVYVTEINSAIWYDQWGDPYTFAFLDYAWNEDITIVSGGSTWDDTVIWDGYDHHTGYNEYYQNITQDNIMVIASIFDEDNNDYAEETTATITGYNTDPKFFDIYFGDTNPPPKIHENVSSMEYSPQDPLNFGTKYYWKIDIWDNQSNLIPGQIMSFTTIENDLPLIPTIFEENDRLFVSTLDPDGDDVFYLIDWDDGTTSDWLGPYQSGEIVEISHEWTEPGTYEIKAKAKDIHNGESDWSDPFTIIVDNVRPNAPTITGPNNGKPGESLTFTFNAVDPDGDNVKFIIDWGDGNSDTTDFVASGTDKSVSNVWDSENTFTITAKAEDEYGLIGPETTFTVTIPREKTIYNSFIQFLQSHLSSYRIFHSVFHLLLF